MGLSIMITGKAGSGKTTACQLVSELLGESGYIPEVFSDRLLLEDAVVDDTGGKTEGRHSIMLDGSKPRGQKKFRAKTGVLINRILDGMVSRAVTNTEGVMVFECALGGDFELPEEPLLLSGEQMLRRFQEHGDKVVSQVMVVEIETEFSKRRERNLIRDDGMEDQTFIDYFPDGGELGRELASQLPGGISFIRIENNHSDLELFLGEVRNVVGESVLPLIEGQVRGKEFE